MTKFVIRAGLAVVALAALASAADAHPRALVQASVRTPVAAVNANVGTANRNSGSLLNVNANVGSASRNSGSLLGVTANVGGLLGVSAKVGGAQETRCDFCGGSAGGVGGQQGW